MYIDPEIKLDYKDVLLLPKRSTLTSRADVDLMREHEFLHSKRKWKGIPIMTANMDTVATIEAAKVLSKNKLLTCLHKFYTSDELIAMSKKRFFRDCIPSIGIKDHDLEMVRKLKDNIDL